MDDSESVGGRTPCGGADPPPTDADGGVPPLGVDDVFDLLSDAQRRRTIEVLLGVAGAVPVEAVAAAVVATATAGDDGSPDPESVDRPARRGGAGTLRETHLPCLEAHGLVNHHSDRDLVVPRPSIRRFAEPLSLANNRTFWRVEDG